MEEKNKKSKFDEEYSMNNIFFYLGHIELGATIILTIFSAIFGYIFPTIAIVVVGLINTACLYSIAYMKNTIIKQEKDIKALRERIDDLENKVNRNYDNLNCDIELLLASKNELQKTKSKKDKN